MSWGYPGITATARRLLADLLAIDERAQSSAKTPTFLPLTSVETEASVKGSPNLASL